MKPPVAAVVLCLWCAVFWSRPLGAQEPPAPIPRFVVDLHANVPRFPDGQTLADSHLLTLGELPGTGLGADLAVHVYPLRWRAITFGIGAQAIAARSSNTPDASLGLRPVTETFLSASPQISLNFGTAAGWSYLSGGIGLTQWSIVPDGGVPLPSDEQRLKTVNYGGGARWFARPHVAFSFDVRFYAINPSTPSTLAPTTPRTTLTVIGAGISIK